MSLSVSYSVTDEFSPTLNSLLSLLDERGREELNQIASRETVNAVKEYHRDFEENGGWENPALSTHGPGRKKTGFGNTITRSWFEVETSFDGFRIGNDAPFYAHKVRGGTITPKRAQALTIPLVPEAHGVRASDYPNKLFIPKGKSYLAEKVGDSEIRAVYALKKSVTHKPWEGALPPEDLISESVTNSYLERIGEAID